MGAGVLVYLLASFLHFDASFSAVQVGLRDNAGTAQASAVATWSRSPQDAIPSAIAKVKLDEPHPLTSPPFTVTAHSGDLSGLVTINFNRAGIFHLIAYDGKYHPIATGSSFGVQPPAQLAFNPTKASPASSSITTVQSTTTARSSTSAPITSSASSQTAGGTPTSVTPTSVTNSTLQGSGSFSSGAVESSSRTAVVISSVLASIFFLLFVVLFVYVFRRRRRRHRHNSSRHFYFHREMMSRNPAHVPLGVSRYLPDDHFAVKDLETAKTEKELPALPYKPDIDDKYTRSRLDKYTSMVTTTSELTSESAFYTNHRKFEPFTDRQMKLEEMIYDLQVEMIGLQRIAERQSLSSSPGDEDLRTAKLKGRIERLTKLKDSNWALGLTDEIPPDLY